MLYSIPPPDKKAIIGFITHYVVCLSEYWWAKWKAAVSSTAKRVVEKELEKRYTLALDTDWSQHVKIKTPADTGTLRLQKDNNTLPCVLQSLHWPGWKMNDCAEVIHQKTFILMFSPQKTVCRRWKLKLWNGEQIHLVQSRQKRSREEIWRIYRKHPFSSVKPGEHGIATLKLTYW